MARFDLTDFEWLVIAPDPLFAEPDLLHLRPLSADVNSSRRRFRGNARGDELASGRSRYQGRARQARHRPVRPGGWHLLMLIERASNIALVPSPERCPELYPQENIWLFMRDNGLSNRGFRSYTDILDHCCYAWSTRIDQS